jgi:heme/copper-type cytochrome/quinol oxidase subunit 1
MTQGGTTLIFEKMRFEPFMKAGSNGVYGRVERCGADEAQNNVVPIAVGAALAALVIIVLILYLIGRRKHQEGYQTV